MRVRVRVRDRVRVRVRSLGKVSAHREVREEWAVRQRALRVDRLGLGLA